MKTLEKMVAGVAVAGLLFGGAAPAVAGDDHGDRGKDRHHSKYSGYKNNKVDVVVEKRHRGEWKKERYEGKSLERAASIAREKCDGGSWKEYYRDAHRVDRGGDKDRVCKKRYVRVYFEQDKRWDKDHDKGHHGKDNGKGHHGKGHKGGH